MKDSCELCLNPDICLAGETPCDLTGDFVSQTVPSNVANRLLDRVRYLEESFEDERERCAALADDHSFALDIDEWMKMTKKEISAYACRSVAIAIRNSQPRSGT